MGQRQILEKSASAIQSWAVEVRQAVLEMMARAQLRQKGGNVVAISASYYGAKDALSSLDDAPVAARDAVSAFREFAFGSDFSLARGVDATMAKTFANAVLQHELLRTLLLPDATLYFRRNWQLPSAVPGGSPVPFRTTWSAGYCLHHLPASEADGSAQMCGGNGRESSPKSGHS